MARDGTGQYNLPTGAVVNATAIDPNDENTTRVDIAAALTGSLARDGQGPMTGPLPMGGNAIQNAGSVTGTAAIFTSMNGGALAGFRNLIINANPIVNQRGYVSGAATTFANQYTLDRWRVVVSGQNLSWTDSLGVRTVTFPAGGGEQVIESASNLGGVHTLSWSGTATATVAAAAVANGAQVTLTGGANVTVRFSGGTASRVMLEPGTQATPFERRPIGGEIDLCQRYFEAGSIVVGFGSFALAATHVYPMRMTQKRASPTVNTVASALTNVSSVTNAVITAADFTITVIATSSGNCGCGVAWTADAEL